MGVKIKEKSGRCDVKGNKKDETYDVNRNLE